MIKPLFCRKKSLNISKYLTVLGYVWGFKFQKNSRRICPLRLGSQSVPQTPALSHSIRTLCVLICSIFTTEFFFSPPRFFWCRRAWCNIKIMFNCRLKIFSKSSPLLHKHFYDIVDVLISLDFLHKVEIYSFSLALILSLLTFFTISDWSIENR